MLKEFDLDAPKEPKDTRQRFRLQTRCITALYERSFVAPKGTGKIWKLLIEAVPSVTKQNVRDLLGVLTVEKAFDVSAFFELTPIKKKAAALDALEKGIERILQYKNWDATPFMTASSAVRKCRFVNEWVWRKPYSKSRSTVSAEVFCQHDLDAFRIYFRIFSRRFPEGIMFPIVSVLPTEFVFVDYLGKAGWERDRFKLFSKSGTLVGEVAVDDIGSAHLIFPMQKPR